MNSKKKGIGILLIVLGLIAILVGSISLWRLLDKGSQDFEPVSSEPVSVQPESSEESSEPADEAYQSPIDFESLQQQNADIYAWLRIPDTPVDYPVFQSPESDEYYLRRNVNKNYAIEGVLFTEKSYNGTDFNDPATIIYGHRMNNGTMFGSLQPTYSDAEGFAAHREIIVYLPEEEKHYTVFAAVPYDKWHILYSYDFSKPQSFWNFFDKIYSTRSLNANFAEDVTPTEEDHILILSTCLKGNSDQRYLVLAKLEE